MSSYSNSLSTDAKNYDISLYISAEAKNMSRTVGNNFLFSLTENELGEKDQ